MDKSLFTSHLTGELKRIDTPIKDWTFIPRALPPDWEFPESLWPLLSEAKQYLGELNGIGRALDAVNLLLSPLQRQEALRSSSLEGTFATPEELLLFELKPDITSTKSDKANSWLEVSNYGKALRHGKDLLSELPLCLRLIREMHGVLMRGVRGAEKKPGQFRSRQYHIGANRRYIPPPPEEMKKCLEHFEDFVNEKGNKHYDPLVDVFLQHYQFEAIHPFCDGNGRVGRALLALSIFKKFNHEEPWLYMSAYFDKHKDEYIDTLFRVSTHGDWTHWIEFCLIGVVEQAKDAIRRADALIKLKREYHRHADGLGVRIHGIIESLFISPITTITEIAKANDVTYPTAKRDIELLLDIEMVSLLALHKRKYFCADKIFEIAFVDEFS